MNAGRFGSNEDNFRIAADLILFRGSLSVLLWKVEFLPFVRAFGRAHHSYTRTCEKPDTSYKDC